MHYNLFDSPARFDNQGVCTYLVSKTVEERLPDGVEPFEVKTSSRRVRFTPGHSLIVIGKFH